MYYATKVYFSFFVLVELQNESVPEPDTHCCVHGTVLCISNSQIVMIFYYMK